MATVYEIVTEKILKSLEEGKAPWVKPWNTVAGPPQNFVSKRQYSGVNLLLLSLAGGSTPYYLTFKQAQSLGGTVKKGEHGYMVTFYTKLQKDKEHEKDGFVLRYYTVFNYDQCDGLSAIEELPRHTWDALESAEGIVKSMNNAPTINYGGGRAFYSPTSDTITLPERENFFGTAEYYETLFHELAHSTGHPTRLDRESIREHHAFGSKEYGREELVAEIAAGFLCATSGVEMHIDNMAAYCRSWIEKIKTDKQAIFWAASRASKAADYITGANVEER